MNAIDPFSLEEMLSKIIQGQSDLEAAQQAQQELIQPVNTNLLNEGQGFKGLWSDPTDNQRQGILQTGLSLLSTHDTNNLSQRIGQAIGQGMSSIREGRELDQKRQLSQSGLDIQRLQGRQQHNQAMAGIGIQLDKSQTDAENRRIDMLLEERRHQENLNKPTGTANLEYSDNGVTRMMPVERRGTGLFVLGTDIPIGDALTEEQLSSGVISTGRPSKTEISFDPDTGKFVMTEGNFSSLGGVGDPTKLNKEISKVDASTIELSREKSRAAEPLIRAARRARDILLSGQNTGAFQPAVQTALGVFKDTLDLVGAGDTGIGRSVGESLSSSETLEGIGKEFAIRALEFFGGSDTERELIEAMKTELNLTADEGTNFNRIEEKILAMDILINRPDFEEKWVRKNGSLANPDMETGETFRKAWGKWQLQKFSEGKEQINWEKEFADKSTDELIDELNRGR